MSVSRKRKAASRSPKPGLPTPPAGPPGQSDEASRTGKERRSKVNFEALLFDIAARFIALPADRIADEILRAQREVCEGLGLDTSSLWEMPPDDPTKVLSTHIYVPLDYSVPQFVMDAKEFFPWTMSRLTRGETVVLERMSDIPPEGARDLESFRYHQVQSTLVFPLTAGEGPMFGVVSFDTIRKPRTWSRSLVQKLGLVAQIFGYALFRKRADQEFRESEARYRNIFERAIEGVYRVSLEGKVLIANPALAKILGYDSAGDFIRSVTDVGRQVWMNPEDRTRCIQQIAREGALKGYECLFKRKDGTPIWVSLNTIPTYGPDGRFAYFDGFVMNIDERKRADEALKKSERFLAETEMIGKVGGWEFDIDTQKQTWTTQTYAIHEVDPTYAPTVEEVIAFFTPASRPVIEQAVRRAMEQGTPYDLELEILTAKGRLRDVRTIGRADLARRRVYGFIQDISQQKQNEREMADLRLERTHLSRVLAVNEISSSLAHEINQPLGAILNNAEAAQILLSQAQDRQETISEIVDDIIQDAKRAGDIVRKVRSVVNKAAARNERLPVHGLIDEALDILHNNLALNNIALRLNLAPDLPAINGDRVRLQQVLLNLVTNALDAMKEAPVKTLTIRSAMEGPDMVTVSVSDSGPGFSEARRAQLFQPYFTTKKDGLGLGLSICRSIVEEHGGRIWADNNPNGGAIFSFSLKAWRGEPAHGPKVQ